MAEHKDPDGENPNTERPVVLPDFDSEEDVFKFVQLQRGELYKGIRASALEGDVKSARVCDALLKSMENQPMQLKKIEVDDKAATNMGEFAKAISEALDNGGVGVTRHDDSTVPEDYTPNFDESEMPSVKLKDGIASTGSNDVDLDKIIQEGIAKSGRSQDED